MPRPSDDIEYFKTGWREQYGHDFPDDFLRDFTRFIEEYGDILAGHADVLVDLNSVFKRWSGQDALRAIEALDLPRRIDERAQGHTNSAIMKFHTLDSLIAHGRTQSRPRKQRKG